MALSVGRWRRARSSVTNCQPSLSLALTIPVGGRGLPGSGRGFALGWVEGRSVKIQYYWTQGRQERVVELAVEIPPKVDVIVTYGQAVTALKKAITVTPIVFAIANDPIGSGLVASLSRPGGNITGCGPRMRETHEAARIHHAHRYRVSGIAIRCASAAAQTAHRRAYVDGRGRSGREARVWAFLEGLQEMGWASKSLSFNGFV